MPQVVVAEEPFDSGDAQELIDLLDEDLSRLYRPEQRFGRRFNSQPDPSQGTFLVARVDGRAVGCGAIKLLDPESAEVKRMYVRPEARGRGIARALLTRLRAHAQQLGARRLVLETGIHSSEAIRLYEGWGFRHVDCWGEYVGVPTSVCYAMEI